MLTIHIQVKGHRAAHVFETKLNTLNEYSLTRYADYNGQLEVC